MSHEPILEEIKKEWHGTAKSYVAGFLGSLVLTLLSFGLVVSKKFSMPFLAYGLVGLALIQAIVQLRLFLHVGQEAKPRWESLVFYFMVMVLLIIAIGSLWIMHDLNERVMEGMQMEMNHD